ncbi:MAG: exodeoxyribonuclease VII large subunit [Alphaproteobacteria bacterium]
MAIEPGHQPDLGGNAPPMTVSEISNALKNTVEDRFSYVRVRGEISGFKRAASGHCYLTLKDADAVLDGVCWRGVAGRLAVKPEDGLDVIVTGKLTTYPGRSKYQIVIESMEMAGEGALLKLLEERKRMLAAEGLFAEDRKRALPYLPEVIGVVTSPTGAVIRDILHRLNDRFPRHVLVWPVLVQGEAAAAQIAGAIKGFNALELGGDVPRPDVLIVARGGGSLEDLWAFNEEIVVRAAANSGIPLISAVGHETDTTLIDFASDRRAPTPTAAAEIAVPVRADLMAAILDIERRRLGAITRLLNNTGMQLAGLSRGLPDPASLLGQASQRLDDYSERFQLAGRSGFALRAERVANLGARLHSPKQTMAQKSDRLHDLLDRFAGAGRRLVARTRDRFDRGGYQDRLVKGIDRKHRQDARALEQLGRRLESVSYKNVLARGFAVVRDANNQPIAKAAGIANGQALTIEMQDSSVSAIASSEAASKPAKTTARKKPAAKNSDDKQGSLL